MINYKNKNYARVEGLTQEQLKSKLEEVYKEYFDDFDSFDDMVKKYAEDTFFHHHYTAKAFLKLI